MYNNHQHFRELTQIIASAEGYYIKNEFSIGYIFLKYQYESPKFMRVKNLILLNSATIIENKNFSVSIITYMFLIWFL